ncbi:cytochrome P450 monooxygenase [Colletotrichum spaethianum]|uniref:Cytochrome P450 monooxygenase n=1 Tax=Colletotrichum spaethianum TaxID=700344 RepID=A0AA37PGQ3_9PEZI|nr:cytochrome P450 monooxygenase [Colletotrichum spaethianum]GKT51986.1 cytochrome P450 monooxygenase [Colletotrichum spaethianum]
MSRLDNPSYICCLPPEFARHTRPWLARLTSFWRISLVLKGKAHDRYRKLHQKYGPIVRTAPNVVDISDPSAISIIYGINSKFLKSLFYRPFDMIYEGEFMSSMFTCRSPEEHKALKRPVAQKFSMTSIRTFEYLVDPCSEIFTESMKDLQGQVVDLGVWAQWYAFDAIGAMTFGQRFGFMEQRKDVENMIAGLEHGLMLASVTGQIPWIHRFFIGNKTLRKIVGRLSLKDPMHIANRKYDAGANSNDRRDFLAYFRQQQKSTGEPMPQKELMNHLINNLLAGSDTTAISLRAIFYYVIRDKRVYRKLQSEIDGLEVAGKLSPVISYGESLQMEYLQVCMKEAMRMHPGVALPLERLVPAGETRLAGHFLSEGTVVGINPAVIHRDREIFGVDADEFRPERWLDEEEKVKSMDRHLLTFGAGVRTCIGKNISLMEMGKFIPQVFRKFELEWASAEPEWDIHTYWFSKQSGLLVRFKER